MDYEEINQSKESLLPHEGPHSKRKINHLPWGTRAWLLTGFNILIFFTSALLLIERQYSFVTRPQTTWLRESTRYSPLWGTPLEKQLKKYEMQMNSTLFTPSRHSQYRDTLKPSKDVDSAWEALEWVRTFPITEQDVVAIGKDPRTAVKFPPDYGFGDNAYVAQLDIFHQLHCLNALRLIAWGQFKQEDKAANRPFSDLHWHHVAHCTEVLRENLMCSANLDVVTFNWKETQNVPFPDFNLNKKCTDAETLIEWQEENALSAETSRGFSRPEGAREVPMEDEYYRLYGLDRVDLEHR
ncbi:hypothetical protein ANO14919_113650 [Xylariales sp. No.14919]|nr:hypothetical protein F5X98DRAFT_389595 [Xylaria grammica]GAW21839.1 hypothetical protein ANO14919_113650 [Xylariales sp. No.14919]